MSTVLKDVGSSGARETAGSYRPDIDGMRAIAVLAVIVNHFSVDVLPGGFLGVDMFFVISGFVITTSVLSRNYESFGELLLDFYSRRIKRLLPALLVCILVTGLFCAIFINPDSEGFSHSMHAGFLALFGVSNFYFFSEEVDYFGLSAKLNLFTHTWSLGVEEQFYLLFPAMVWSVQGFSRGAKRAQALRLLLTVLTALSFAGFIWLNHSLPAAAYFMMPPRFFELSVGCLVAIAPSFVNAALDRRANLWSWLALLLVFGGFCVESGWQALTTPLVVVASAALILTSRPTSGVYSLLTNRWALFVGQRSYSLYLWHWSVLSASRWTVGVDARTAPFQVVAILLLGVGSYLYVERPLRRASWTRWKPVTIALGLATLAAAGFAVNALNTEFKGSLYAGSPVQMVTKGMFSLFDEKKFEGKTIWRADPCVLASNDEVGKKIDANVCTLGGPSAATPTFLVIGDSFSAAEFELYSALYENGLGKVVATATWAAMPVPEVKIDNNCELSNQYYWDTVIPQLAAQLRAGDVLLMVNDLWNFTPKDRTPADDERLELLETGLSRIAAEFRAKGVAIVFQSHNPFMRESGCTPDIAKPQWFNLSDRGPCVYYTKEESLRRMAPLRATLERVRRSHGNFFVLDLFPVMCSGEVCGFYSHDQQPLYRDEWSHMSVEANYLARPVFLQTVKEALNWRGGEQ
jgi:peptidoglycan/LPS O-acetylase OafA/YrhL